MAVTAIRLGSSPLTLDWTQLPRKMEPEGARMAEAWSLLKSKLDSRAPSASGFYDAPIRPEVSQIAECQKLAESLIKNHSFTDCLFLGIGGSALGPASLVAGLHEKCTSGIRFHVVEIPDPVLWKTTLRELRPETTLVCCVTKSGTTVETVALFLSALEWLGKTLWKTHVIAITDPEKGDLRSFAQQEGIACLSIAPNIGGRYSVFSPVGLFAAALAGLDTDAFLLGAKQVRDYLEKTPVEKNPLFILSSELLRYFPKRSIHVCMPYSARLRGIGNWFVQLWAESLGKDGKGFTPLAALGPTDQHSILQLLRDGPDDKVTFFLTVDQTENKEAEMAIPRRQAAGHYASFAMVEGATLHQLMQIEFRATALVLTKAGRPNVTIGLDHLDERAFGALYFLFCTLTALTGVLWEVNPFDQPGVEEGKIYIQEALRNRYTENSTA